MTHMSAPIDEATSGEVPPEIVEHCRQAEVKRLYDTSHVSEEGTLEIGGKKRGYKFTKPPPRSEPCGDAPCPGMIQFAGVVEIAGKAMPYSIVRFNRDGFTESFISVNGNKARVVREPAPQRVVYEGRVEVQTPSSFDYKVTQSISRGEAALERDELEGILTLQNNAAHAAVDRGDLVRGSKARRLRRLARSRESDADEQFS